MATAAPTDQEHVTAIKAITDHLQATAQILTNTAKNLGGLVVLGRATCEEIKTYNLFAISTYNAQKALLTQLRALGQANVPEAPHTPTFFLWKDVPGAEAWRVDCGTPAKSLSGALAAAISSTQVAAPQYVSADAIRIVTGDSSFQIPTIGVPSPDQIHQAIRKAGDGGLAGLQGMQPLGIFGLDDVVVLVIVISIVCVASVVVALAKYATENSIQQASVENNHTDAKKYDTLIAARMDCLSKCLANKGTIENCRSLCTDVVSKPPANVGPKSGTDTGMGTLEQIGLATLAAGALLVGYKLFLKHRENMAV